MSAWLAILAATLLTASPVRSEALAGDATWSWLEVEQRPVLGEAGSVDLGPSSPTREESECFNPLGVNIGPQNAWLVSSLIAGPFFGLQLLAFVLAYLGKARRVALTIEIAGIIDGLILLGLGIAALLKSQPPEVWLPFLGEGVVLLAISICLFWCIRKYHGTPMMRRILFFES